MVVPMVAADQQRRHLGHAVIAVEPVDPEEVHDCLFPVIGQDHALAAAGHYSRSRSEHVAKALIDPIPLGRLGTPEDLVGIVLYLASDEAAWTTGQSFIVDGGHPMK